MMNGEKRIETKTSRTASYTCFARGCATREKDPRFRGPDYLAEEMFPFLARLSLNFSPARKFLMRRMFPPGIYAYVLARTRIMDSVFSEALDAHVAQIVLLGAGFDTRALRFADRNRGTRIFELDVPTAQEPKRDILRKKKISLPAELTFVPINFDKEDISAVLSGAGFQTGGKTLFLWEGVTMYLTAGAVDGTLDFIRRRSAPGSRVVFDYIYASVLRRENRYYGERNIYDTIRQTGEGWTFGLEDGAVESFLAERGFALVAHYTPPELEKMYLTAEDGTLHDRVNGTHCITVAEVQPYDGKNRR
jgi:methyltransferase (TIGR00027 family)